MEYDIIITGAGAAGLLSMKLLLQHGYTVCTLEAAKEAGGRINTITGAGFDDRVEGGAEFIHGPLALTLQLLGEAGISYYPTGGEMIRRENGRWIDTEEDNSWELFMQQLQEQEQEVSIREFLDKHFAAGKYRQLYRAVQQFAEGFDLADINDASVLSAKAEWTHREETQYRITGGYKKLVEYLLQYCHKANSNIFYDACVNRVAHHAGHVTVYTTDGRSFRARKIIITASAGMLQSGAIKFIPEITTHTKAIAALGFGAVIKVLLQFKTAFWNNYTHNTGFILSNEAIPTWWTQLPRKSSLLTGWLGGPEAAKRAADNDVVLLQTALASLSAIFDLPVANLQQQLVQHKIICWHNQPYVKGGYSYNTVYSRAAKAILSVPVNNTIFFAGEAFYQGQSQGTVEAALQHARETISRLHSTWG